jgi:hypothetical protein
VVEDVTHCNEGLVEDVGGVDHLHQLVTDESDWLVIQYFAKCLYSGFLTTLRICIGEGAHRGQYAKNRYGLFD